MVYCPIFDDVLTAFLPNVLYLQFGTGPAYNSLAQKLPDCHVVAVRITAEDANDGFKPTCGRIDEIHFR